jgi:hypothetical protein
MKIALATLSICLLSTTAIAAEQAKDPRVECGVAAVTEYNKAMLALTSSAQGNPAEFLSVESTITTRRLQES